MSHSSGSFISPNLSFGILALFDYYTKYTLCSSFMSVKHDIKRNKVDKLSNVSLLMM